MAEGVEQEASSFTKKKNNDKTIDDFLSEEGKFAFMRLCSIELCSLFPAKHERPFVKKLVCDLVKDARLPTEVQSKLVGCLLCDMDVDVQDFEATALCNTELMIKTLKDECQKQQNLVVLPKHLILFALKSEKYDARLRVLIYSVAVKLNISPDNVADLEDELVDNLHNKTSQEESEENERRKEEESSRKFRRGLMIGLGAIGGGALIGITGGLAAPLIAAGVGSLVGGSAAVAIASIKGVAILTSLFGAAGAGLTGQKLSRRMGEIEQFEFEKLTKGEHLHVVIAISGWLKQEENAFEGDTSGFIEPWKKMKLGREQYCLKWESKYLVELGTAISQFIASSVMSLAAEEAIKHTVIQGLVNAVAWPLTFLKFGYVIDNPWGVCASRSAEVGKHLANVLMERQHGNRPVTLVGFSFGARVIFHCLTTMSSMKGSEGIIQDVIVIGAPVTGDPDEWKYFEKIVNGRVINGYCKKDWLLKFAYRTASVQVKVAGLGPVPWKNRRMFNVNLTSLVNRHGDYSNPEIMEEILDAVSMGGVCPLDIEETSSHLNASDSGIASSVDSIAEPTTAQENSPAVYSEEVRLAMEELHKKVERVLAEEEEQKKDEARREQEEPTESPCDDSLQESASVSEGLSQPPTTLLPSEDNPDMNGIENASDVDRKDSKELPFGDSQEEHRSILEQLNTKTSSQFKDNCEETVEESNKLERKSKDGDCEEQESCHIEHREATGNQRNVAQSLLMQNYEECKQQKEESQGPLEKTHHL